MPISDISKTPSLKTIVPLAALLATAMVSVSVRADGFAVDKVYRPYVEWNEKELEWRVTAYEDPDNDEEVYQAHRFGIGRAFGDRLFTEVYLVAADRPGREFEIQAYEGEVLYQLTEQGEYWADFGVLVEVEKEREEDIWEGNIALLVEKEFGQFSTTVNLEAGAEWGDAIEDETESRLAVQTRYRYSPEFEPALELHSAEDTRALGPVLLGDIRMAGRQNLHWEIGYFVGLDSETPDNSLRANIEFEF